ncbi:uncharacterized protein LOC131954655 [Physella acuta]|uniref:uncharacterized protein LOC131954655 n=1 Tax=Physella acuta TaxID=109671 RepID=UPI0027DC9F53|nr:uncharacterized protein LOC131954655 [Physella acuta]
MLLNLELSVLVGLLLFCTSHGKALENREITGPNEADNEETRVVSPESSVNSAESEESTSTEVKVSTEETSDEESIEESPGANEADSAEVPEVQAPEVVSQEEIEESEEENTPKYKRSVTERRTLLTGPSSSLSLTLVERGVGRFKRTIQPSTILWPEVVPYVVDPSYQALGDYYIILLKRAIKYIMSRLCLSFVDVTAKYDPNDPTWFTNNGFAMNSFLQVKNGVGCVAGNGPGRKPTGVSPCQDFVINMHEILHTLGGVHTQQGAPAKYYLTVNFDNVDPAYRGTYIIYPPGPKFFNSGFFDPDSSLMYGSRTWSRNALDTYTPIRDDIFNSVNDVSSDNVLYYELNQVYQCREKYCNNEQVDCGSGYYTLINGKCQCVCPDEWDPATNCKSLRNGPSSTATWPNTAIALIAGGPSHTCPSGFQGPGWYSFTGAAAMSQSSNSPPVALPISGATHFTPICTRPLPAGVDEDWETWPPGGQYCLIKPAMYSCGGAYVETSIELGSRSPIQFNGSLGDTTFKDNNVTQKYCCRYQEPSFIPIELPDAEPFRLIVRSSCPKIRGLKSAITRQNWWTSVASITEQFPSTTPYWLFSTSVSAFSCYYTPPKYGCNQQVYLDASNPSITIATPGTELGQREPNRRCLYMFDAPPNSQFKVTFNLVSISTANDDQVLYKRYHKWQEPNKINPANYPYQIVSESNYFSLEYWSAHDRSSLFRGLNFTVSVILPEDQCYFDKGDDYYGKTDVTETAESCLPWSETIECDSFSTIARQYSILSGGNGCRNPGNDLIQPWCYVARNGSNCDKRYCDACNAMVPVDSIRQCTSLISANPDFCKSGVQRFRCFKSCGFSQQPTARATCGDPTLPADGVLVDTPKSSYKEGEIVGVKCKDSDVEPVNEMMCTADGWSTLLQACKAPCADKGTNCDKLMASSPKFCTHPNTNATAEQYCSKSCGRCAGGETCSVAGGATYSITSGSSTLKAGEAVTFACNAGYFYVSGDLTRACSVSGALLGSEPVCQETPVATDVNLNGVFMRQTPLKDKTVHIMDTSEYRMPFAGKITRWYYQCKAVVTSPTVSMMIFRRASTGYTFVGANNVTCPNAEIKWSFYVPAASQITVQPDDVIGMFTLATNTISTTDCKKAMEKLSTVGTATANTFFELTNKPVVTTSACIMASVGVRLEPV